MTLKATLRSFDEVAAHLPFHVDDIESANAAFLRWHRSRTAEDLRIVDLWVYCFVRHYFVVKFLRDSAYGPADLDLLVTKAFSRTRDNLDKVGDPTRFASWVSVICRNIFINFLRRHRERFSLDPDRHESEEPPFYGEYDGLLARRATERAIQDLPPFLQEVARLRYLEDYPYEVISANTGHSVPTVRAYAHRAVTELRRSPALRALFQDSPS